MKFFKSKSSKAEDSVVVEQSLLKADKTVYTKGSKQQNEDFGELYKGKYISAIAIADGLGSSVDAYIASKLAVTAFLNEVRINDIEDRELEIGHIEAFWNKAASEISAYYEAHKEHYTDKENFLETTLITLIELKDKYLISYLGNGSIWHVRGDFWHFWNRQWPWCVSDLMIGHTVLCDSGKEALYGVLGHKGPTANMRFLILPKDPIFGELFVLTTDGISSPDQLKTGRDPNNKLWCEANPHIDSLLNTYLAEYFKESKIELTYNNCLDNSVSKFLKERSFNDDATIGILVSRKAIENYIRKNT